MQRTDLLSDLRRNLDNALKSKPAEKREAFIEKLIYMVERNMNFILHRQELHELRRPERDRQKKLGNRISASANKTLDYLDKLSNLIRTDEASVFQVSLLRSPPDFLKEAKPWAMDEQEIIAFIKQRLAEAASNIREIEAMGERITEFSSYPSGNSADKGLESLEACFAICWAENFGKMHRSKNDASPQYLAFQHLANFVANSRPSLKMSDRSIQRITALANSHWGRYCDQNR